ncbi:hypothetical protein [uncultured Pontibacter sp.]|uniref:hypothetical protein n=1 Tax=uncultured Pontibacter sp. TaxID=453356 RepID=UPI002608CC3C|nr:hypothetical protein [uncultured Pontibacter sp.]
MKNKFILYPLLTGLLVCIGTFSFAQSTEQKPKTEQQLLEEKEKADKTRLSDASDLRKETKADAKIAKANAKEARRIDKEAADAAKQAKRASKMEAKAQRNRADADKQSEKAAKASEKSGKNN